MTNHSSSRLSLVVVAISLLFAIMTGCNNSSTNPTIPPTTNDELVGTWRFVAHGNADVTGTQIVVAAVPDSAYMTIYSGGNFLYVQSGSFNQRLAGHSTSNGTSLTCYFDTLVNGVIGYQDTLHVGDSLKYTVVLVNANELIMRDTSRTLHTAQYEAYAKVGTDVKIAGVTASFNNIGIGGVPITNSTPGLSCSTTSNSWGFYCVSGLSNGNWRLSGFLNGIAYDNMDTVRVTHPGVYVRALER